MAMRAALRPGGLACQWLPVYQLDAGSLGGILRAWEAVFPGGHAWWLRWNVDVPVVGLMGFTQPPALDGGWFDRRVGSGPLLASLRSVGLGDGYQLMGGWLGSVSNLGAFQLGDWVPVDDRPSLAVRVPWLASGTPAEVWERMRSLSALREEQGPFGSGPGSASWRERLSAYRRARDAYLIGLKADMSGSRLEAENRFLESVRASPEFPSGYSQLLSRAVARLREDPSGARSLLRTLAEIRPEQTVAESLLRRIDQGSGAP